ncbi:hypothetical protein [Amycolatopsis sp. CA-230715]|uniref:hypothetical protein n=1 Tax=Amycolatopsis sp. CA-230715 TaxID=2745196 RepID=UPI001C03820C|nr:hypothetical protein [Amycolatopsis sp. CA-230715]QWF85754.1 hypothetical protein HUW46_09234 [Amycolatopsis sp. CA-230715]
MPTTTAKSGYTRRVAKVVTRVLVTSLIILNVLFLIPTAVFSVMTGLYTALLVGIGLSTLCWVIGRVVLRVVVAAVRSRHDEMAHVHAHDEAD